MKSLFVLFFVLFSLNAHAFKPPFITVDQEGPYDFGDVPVGDIACKKFTFTNEGDAETGNMVVVGIIDPFFFAGGVYPGTGGTCGKTLQPGQSCDMALCFEPIYAAVQSFDVLFINYFNGEVFNTLRLGLFGYSPSY